jgi:phosphatidylserine/phosphatidylglycerophosphate/cardiolipin synthase-like enzyme
MRNLQHNKTIVVDGPAGQVVACGSTNFSWRAFFVQNNNAMILQGAEPVAIFARAFDNYWSQTPVAFGATDSAHWAPLGLAGIDAQVAFSPHAPDNALLAAIGTDIGDNTASSLFYSLAFLYQTTGPILDAIKKVTADDAIFVYGISDRQVGGLDLQKPDGSTAPVFPSQLSGNVPPPFSMEPTGGSGVRVHHKFTVIDFNQPTARAYVGSYNFSSEADMKNGENLSPNPRPPHRRLLHGRSPPHLRPLPLPRPSGSQATSRPSPYKAPAHPSRRRRWQEDYTVPYKSATAKSSPRHTGRNPK